MRLLFLKDQNHSNQLGNCSYSEWRKDQSKTRTKELSIEMPLWHVMNNIEEYSSKVAFVSGGKFEKHLKQYILEIEPEIIIADQLNLASKNLMLWVRNRFPETKFISRYCITMSTDHEYIPLYDLLLGCTPSLVQQAQSLGGKCALFYHTWEPSEVLKTQLTSDHFKIEKSVVFLGSVVLNTNHHMTRAKILLALSKALNERFCLLGEIHKPDFRLRDWFIRPLKCFKISRKYAELKRIARPALFRNDYYMQINKSMLIVNPPIDLSGCDIGNIRLFEAAALGTPQIIPQCDNLKDLFEENKEIITYQNKSDLIRKVRLLLQSPNYLSEIGERSQKRWERDHSTKARANLLSTLIHRCLS